MMKIKWKHYINYIVVFLFTLIFGLSSIIGGLDSSLLYMFEKVAISIILAVSLSFVVGFLGELSLGHAGFMCVGAYIGGKVSSLLVPSLGNGVLALLISVVVGAVCAGACGFIIGLPALRLRGDYLAIVTLAFGEIVKTLFQNTTRESFGGALGLSTPRFDKNYLFIIAFVFVLLTLFVIQNLIRSKHGRAITAIRDNEIAAHACGINVTKYKLLVFIVSAALAGVAGVLYSYSNFTVQSAKFDYNYSIQILVMVVLGGMGSVNGSILSATLITYLNIKLSTILTGNLAVLQNLVYALILVIIVIYNNAPALAGVREKYNLKNLINKLFKIKFIPSKRKDDEGAWDKIPTKIKMDEILTVDMTAQESVMTPDKPSGGEENE